MPSQGVFPKLAVAVLATTLSACAWGPGMRVNEGAIERRAEKSGEDPKFVLVPLTPQVVKEHLEASLQRREPTPDPLGEQAARYAYKVAPHDVLSVIVWGHPELTIPAGEFRSAEATGHPVTADGKMFYPHVGTIDAAGKTLPQLRELLTARLKGVLQNPQLDVKVAAYRGMKVRVTGEVKTPTTFPVTDVPLRALDAITLAGGQTPEADLQQVVLTRGGQAYRLDLQAVNERGDATENWLLQDEDTLHVPDRMLNKVFVLGEVQRPSSRLMHKGRMTLAEAIGDTEGLDPVTSNAAGIYVIRGSYEVPRVFRLDATNPDALLLAAQFPLQPLDVVFVSSHRLTQWNRIVTQLMPTIQAVTQPLYYLRGVLLLP
jgi:polysaccharide biosynthesis/export protein